MQGEWFRELESVDSYSIALGLLQIGAVELRPHDLFQWSSGWKSPVYCDNRLILGYPVLRSQVISGFKQVIEREFPGVDVVAGTATAGIPHAAYLSHELQLPMAYVRSSSKSHGKQRQVEGRIHPGMKAIVIEDTLSTGKSAYQAVDALRTEGAQVLGVLSIFSYDFDAAIGMARERKVPAWRLVTYDKLARQAVASGYLAESDMGILTSWREHPETFGQE